MLVERDQRYVSIAAAFPYELAHEMKNVKNGALTFHLLKALERAKPETTYRQLMSEVANAVTADYPSSRSANSPSPPTSVSRCCRPSNR